MRTRTLQAEVVHSVRSRPLQHISDLRHTIFRAIWLLLATVSISLFAVAAQAVDSRTICGETVTSASAYPSGFDPNLIPLDGSFSIRDSSSLIFLGTVSSSETETYSILNPSGIYGSAIYTNSIFNTGIWGSSSNIAGACNSNATSPPIIYSGNVGVRYLTTNQSFGADQIDPRQLVATLLKQAPGTATTTTAATTSTTTAATSTTTAASPTTTTTATTTTAATTSTTTAATTSTTTAATSTTTAATTTTTTTATTTTTTLAGSTVTLSLTSGWNLVGNSSSGTLDIAAAFGDTTKVTTVWKWIANGAKWAFYAPSLAGQTLTDYAAGKGYDVLTAINGGEGFWVNAKTAFTVQLPAGSAISSASYQTGLATGWNLIAIGDGKTPSQFNGALGVAPIAGEIPINLTTLWAWGNAQGNWYFYAPSLEKNGGLAGYITSKSYLDFGAKVLDPSMGFWVNKP